jgi:hypothetical protein
VKARASLLKTLTRFDRCSKMYLARIETDSTWTLNSGDTDELAQNVPADRSGPAKYNEIVARAGIRFPPDSRTGAG